MKTKQDVFDALNKIDFLKRTAELAQKYRRNAEDKSFVPGKAKIIDMINRMGYKARFVQGTYIVEVEDSDFYNKNCLEFYFYYSWFQFYFDYCENNERIYYGHWRGIKTQLANDEDYRSGSPAFKSYEDIEEILAEAIKIYKDSLGALYNTRL